MQKNKQARTNKMAYLFTWHPSSQKVLDPPQGLEQKHLDDGLGEMEDGGKDEKLSVLLLPKPLVLALDAKGLCVFPGLSFPKYPTDRTNSVEIMCTKNKADVFVTDFFRIVSETYIAQNVLNWDKLPLRVGKRVNLRQLFGAQGNANPVVLVATDDLLALLREDIETRAKRAESHSDSDDSSPVQYSERLANPEIVIFCPGSRASFYPSPPNRGYNHKKSPGYLAAKLEDFFEVRMPGRVMAMLPFPIAVMESTGHNFFLHDVFKGNATYSFLVEGIHWEQFINVAMPLFSKQVVHTDHAPKYYNSEE